MENTRDLRFFNFDNRFPDVGTNEEIMTYLRELKSQLNMWQEKLLATTDALTLKTVSLEDGVTALDNKLKALDDRVAALEESDE